MPRACPVPGCVEMVPAGTSATFCATHYFQLPRRTAKELIALKFACSRADDDEEKLHLRDQINARVSIAVRCLSEASHVA